MEKLIWLMLWPVTGVDADGVSFTSVGSILKAREGKWIGAKVGFYALREGIINDAGAADIDLPRLPTPITAISDKNIRLDFINRDYFCRAGQM